MMKNLDLDMCGLGLTILDVVVFLVFCMNGMARRKKNSRLFKYQLSDQDISHDFSVVIFPLPFTTGDDKRSLFNIVGNCCINTGTTQS